MKDVRGRRNDLPVLPAKGGNFNPLPHKGQRQGRASGRSGEAGAASVVAPRGLVEVPCHTGRDPKEGEIPAGGRHLSVVSRRENTNKSDMSPAQTRLTWPIHSRSCFSNSVTPANAVLRASWQPWLSRPLRRAYRPSSLRPDLGLVRAWSLPKASSASAFSGAACNVACSVVTSAAPVPLGFGMASPFATLAPRLEAENRDAAGFCPGATAGPPGPAPAIVLNGVLPDIA